MDTGAQRCAENYPGSERRDTGCGGCLRAAAREPDPVPNPHPPPGWSLAEAEVAGLRAGSDSLPGASLPLQPAWTGPGTWHSTCAGLCKVRTLSSRSPLRGSLPEHPSHTPRHRRPRRPTSSRHGVHHALTSPVHCPFPHVYSSPSGAGSHWSWSPGVPRGPAMCSITQETNERGSK